MRISYIIPVYNVPTEMLQACLRSIEAAFRAGMNVSENGDGGLDYEIIIVDDGSEQAVEKGDLGFRNFGNNPDVRESGSPEITLIRQENQGLSAARNRGIAAATGDYIQFVDGDDELIPEQYARILEILREEKPEILSFSFELRMPKKPKPPRLPKSPRFLRHPRLPMSPRPLRMPKTTGASHLLNNNLRVAACFYLFRRGLLEEARGAEGGVLGADIPLRFEKNLKNEDERFTPQLFLRAKTLIATDIPAYFYRQREGSLQHSYSKEFVEKRLSDYFSTMVFLRELDGKAFERRVRQMAMDYIYNVICLTHSGESLRRAVEALREEGLFPLPHCRYTAKFWLFSYIINSRIGRWLMLRLLPLMPKEI